MSGRILKTVDSVYQDVQTIEECRELCLNSPFRCHSYDHGDTGDHVCRLSHHSKSTLADIQVSNSITAIRSYVCIRYGMTFLTLYYNFRILIWKYLKRLLMNYPHATMYLLIAVLVIWWLVFRPQNYSMVKYTQKVAPIPASLTFSKVLNSNYIWDTIISNVM